MVKKRQDEKKSSRSYSILHVEIMFFHAARRHLELAKEGWSPVEKALKELKKLDVQWDRLQADDVQLDDNRLERIAISTEHQFESVGFAYAPVLEHIAIVHLLCTNCLEATINAIGKDLLNGSMFEEFDKLSLTGKWLFLPKIRGLKGFDAGKEPFQSFKRMVSFRNVLTHYRPKKEDGPAFAVPMFLASLGLTVKDAENSVKVTRKMVGDIHKQLNREMDCGWDAERWTYFGIDFNRDKT
ncbi:MAG: hypothetical protein ACLP9L_25010 [Thermoguttaceae bacterium]